MANKTNPIGVRFRENILEKLKIDHGIESPQKALVFLEQFYVSHHTLAKDAKGSLKEEKDINRLTFKKPKPKEGKVRIDKLESNVKFDAPPEFYDGEKLNQYIADEPGQYQIKKPSTFAELKAMCPPELTGLERSEWIAKKRREHGL